MTLDERTYAELRELVVALCERGLSDSQAGRLEELVLRHAEAREFYVDYLHLHAGLARLAASDPEARLLAQLESLSAADATSTAPSPGLPRIAPSTASELGVHRVLPRIILLAMALPRLSSWISAAAALVVVGATVSVALWLRDARENDRPVPLAVTAPAPAGPQFIATLVRAPGCKWDSSQLPTEVGARLFPGRLRLAEGRALVEFDSGARILLQGPTVFELRSAMAARLLSGKLSVNVPEKARGFTVDTLSTKVVDLGTEFGLIAEPSGASELHVLEGIVELEPYSDQTALSKSRVLAGQARRIDSRAASSWEEVPFDAGKFNSGALEFRSGGREPRKLFDDFQAESLDVYKWRVVTDGILPGGASVAQTDGHVELVNRGYLVTSQQFDPRAVGPLRIRGRWTFNSGKDYLQVVTRSTAEPTGEHGETASGIEFSLNAQTGRVSIDEKPEGRTTQVGAGIYRVKEGDIVDFEILDDGLYLTFALKKVGDDGDSITVTGTSGLDFAQDYVVFHNRERRPTSIARRLLNARLPLHQNMVVFLDDVSIETGGQAGSAAAVKRTQ